MKKVLSILTVIFVCLSMLNLNIALAANVTADVTVDLSNLTYTANGNENSIKVYTLEDFNQFVSDYNSGSLPEIYVTEFLFDGVETVKTYDLDDFTEAKSNDVTVKTLELSVININRTGNIGLTGTIKGGMVAVNTNEKAGEINLILNGVNIDTDNKKAPAIYVYNKDINYTDCKVTIKTVSGTKNYITGGKLKKVSLVGSDELSNYTDKYSGDAKTNYETYTNYYGVYTSEQINNILFAKVQADNEDLSDGDPYYFYKASGAISSDIDLYFEGEGYLEVTSTKKEGIETKGNLTLSGGTGDYVIYAQDDCLNTTTDSTGNNTVRNTLTIDVNSLTAIVDLEADEGDAIDSNGTLIINGGTITALAHPGSDAGLDSSKGTYINGGTVIATGDMYDEISSESKQNFAVFNFKEQQSADTTMTLVNSNGQTIMEYKAYRTYTNLVYSSADLTDGTYYLYKDGVEQGYSSTGIQGGQGGPGDQGEAPTGQMPNDGNGENDGNKPEIPSQEQDGNSDRTPPTRDESQNDENRPELPSNEEDGNLPQGRDVPNTQNNDSNSVPSNKEFKISGVSNLFSGVGDYTETDNTTANTILPNAGVSSAIALLIVVAAGLGIYFYRRQRKEN